MNNRKITSPKSAKLWFAFFAVAFSGASNSSSFNDAMESKFNSLSNTTSAQSYMGARRGVFTGGQAFIGNDVKRVDVVSAAAPSYSAGCGGIDIFGGSFSFINADEMIETFQAIGSNAIGYGVKLALNNMCTSCEQVMTSLEKTAQSINKLNIDSCQAAEGIVNASVDFASGAQSEVISAAKSSAMGIYDDFSSAWSSSNTDGDSASTKLKNADPVLYAEEVTGNITWRSMIRGGVKDQYLNGDEDLLKIFQTMVGTVVITDKEGGEESGGDSNPSIEKRAGHAITLEQLIVGSESEAGESDAKPFKVYECNDGEGEDECIDISSAPTKEVTGVIGFQKRLSNALIGENGNGGVVQAMMDDTEWSDEAKTFLSVKTPFALFCLQKIREAATLKDVGTAGYIADSCSQRMALDVSYSVIQGYITGIYTAILKSKNKQKSEALSLLSESREAYKREYETLAEQAKIELVVQQINMAINTLKPERKQM